MRNSDEQLLSFVEETKLKKQLKAIYPQRRVGLASDQWDTDSLPLGSRLRLIPRRPLIRSISSSSEPSDEAFILIQKLTTFSEPE